MNGRSLQIIPSPVAVIASGVLTCTGSYGTVDTESEASSDTVTSVTGLGEGEHAWLSAASGSRTVIFEHGASIYCDTESDITLADQGDMVHLIGIGGGIVAASLWRSKDPLAGGYGAARADDEVIATVAVANATGGATTAALTLALKRIDGTTAIASERQVLILGAAAQYAGAGQSVSSHPTFGSATTGSIVASGSGWALVQTDAAGAFACTVTNSSDETLYFWAQTAHAVSDTTKTTIVRGSNSDAATWSA